MCKRIVLLNIIFKKLLNKNLDVSFENLTSIQKSVKLYENIETYDSLIYLLNLILIIVTSDIFHKKWLHIL